MIPKSGNRFSDKIIANKTGSLNEARRGGKQTCQALSA